MSATYNGQTLADGDEIEAQLAEGRMLGPSPVLADGDVAGLTLTEGWVAVVLKGGPDGVRVRVRAPSAQGRRRHALRAVRRRLKQAVRAGDLSLAQPLDQPRLLLALLDELFGEEESP